MRTSVAPYRFSACTRKASSKKASTSGAVKDPPVNTCRVVFYEKRAGGRRQQQQGGRVRSNNPQTASPAECEAPSSADSDPPGDMHDEDWAPLPLLPTLLHSLVAAPQKEACAHWGQTHRFPVCFAGGLC